MRSPGTSLGGVSVPKHAHPLARLVFAEMGRQKKTYADMEWESGVLISTIKEWRKNKRPGLETIEAALGAVGYTLVPVPSPNTVPAHLQDQFEEVGQHFISDHETLGAALLVAIDGAASLAMTGRGARDRRTPEQTREQYRQSRARYPRTMPAVPAPEKPAPDPGGDSGGG